MPIGKSVFNHFADSIERITGASTYPFIEAFVKPYTTYKLACHEKPDQTVTSTGCETKKGSIKAAKKDNLLEVNAQY